MEAAPRTSSYAAASLLCSVGICCPALSVIGVLLGVRALVEMKAHPDLAGRGLARAGIAIGLAAIVLWAVGGVWWHFNARQPMLHGPREPLQRGLAGEVAAFERAFVQQDASPPVPGEGATFLNQVYTRYGRLIESRQSESTPALAAPPSGAQQAYFRIRYDLRFERAAVVGEAEFVTFAPASVVPRPVFKWRWLRIIDPQRGDLAYPAAAADQASSPPPTPATQP